MADREIRVARADEVAATGALTAEAYRADGLIDDGDEYAAELLDAARRAREAMLLVALVPSAPTKPGGAAAAAGRDTARRRQTAGVGGSAHALVGTVTLAPAGSPYAEIAGPGELEVRMLAVSPQARRRGIAEELTRAAMLEAVRLGAQRVVLSTLDTMTSAHRLYHRAGFGRVPGRDWQHGGVAFRVYTWDVPAGPGARVETASWHPREVRDVGGWRVGLSGGFTRRGNSVVALADPTDVQASIDEVERVYAARGLPSIFRICAQSRPEDLDDVLRVRGYRDVAPTLVMVRERLEELAGLEELAELAAIGSRDEIAHVVAHEPDDEWLAGWLAAKAIRPVDPLLAAAVLSGTRAVYVRVRAAGRTVAVARAALEQDWVGLSCLAVQPDARRRGVGRVATLEALRVAAVLGARRAFLQVEESNEAAIGLYGQLRFLPAQRYHYRER